MKQVIIQGIEGLSQIVEQTGARRILLVCGRSFDSLPVRDAVLALPVQLIRFSEFTPNPDYEEICRGVERFRRERCDALLAVGGGSAIDTAKCIKLFCGMEPGTDYLGAEKQDTHVPLIALPTTAGSGSESTKNAVLYRDGVKQSISHESLLPNCAVLVPGVLSGLPLYQKKSAMLDALSQAIESFWSVRSTEESRVYAREAIGDILANWRRYIEENDAAAAAAIMKAANTAGKAINLTATTAPHAMSYRLTKLYGLPHGHAAALSLPEVWEYMLDHPELCTDPRGQEYLKKTLSRLSTLITPGQFRALLQELEMNRPVSAQREEDLDALAASVNMERLQNNPVALNTEVLRRMYERIVKE